MESSNTLWVYGALMITTIILSLFLLVVILARKNLRQQAFNQLVVSMALGSVIFNLFIRPGTIYDENGTYEMDKGYCGMYQLLLKVEWYFMPLMFWMMSIERLIVLREQENYFKKMTIGARAALVAVPWCYAAIFAVLTLFILGDKIATYYGSYPDEPHFEKLAHHGRFQCTMLYTESNEEVHNHVMLVFGTIIPVLALSASGLALLIIFFRRRSIQGYNSEGMPFVSTGSIILCHLLNLSAVIMLLWKAVLANIATRLFLRIHYWSLVELFAVILAMCVLPDVRKVMGGICCYCCKKPNAENHSLHGVSEETQTSKASNQSEK